MNTMIVIGGIILFGSLLLDTLILLCASPKWELDPRCTGTLPYGLLLSAGILLLGVLCSGFSDYVHFQALQEENSTEWAAKTPRMIHLMRLRIEEDRQHLKIAPDDSVFRDDERYFTSQHNALVRRYTTAMMRHCHGSQCRGAEKYMPQQL